MIRGRRVHFSFSFLQAISPSIMSAPDPPPVCGLTVFGRSRTDIRGTGLFLQENDFHEKGGAAMSPRILVALCAMLLLPVVVAAQEKPKVKTAPIARTSANNGQQMFQSYCAACHGKEAKGDGPAAAALKKAPADLTTLSARNGGTFPTVKVSRFIEGLDEVPAHGSREMPMWVSLFRSLGPDSGTAQIRIKSLTDYLKSIQK